MRTLHERQAAVATALRVQQWYQDKVTKGRKVLADDEQGLASATEQYERLKAELDDEMRPDRSAA